MTGELVTTIIGVVVAAVLASIGALIAMARNSLQRDIERLEHSFTRIGAEIAADVKAIEQVVTANERRITRIESWKEMVSLPPVLPRDRPGNQPRGTSQ